jgi:ABC-type methionine transport system ATPase subunit
MAILFRDVSHGPIRELTASAPDGAIIGIIGLKGSGKAALLRLAAGLEQPAGGTIEGGASRRLIQLGEPLNFAPVDVLLLDAALACQDPLVRERACFALERLRRGGATILLASYDEPLLARLCDELWWIDQGTIAAKGDVREVLPKYRRFVLERLIAWGGTLSEPVDFTYRRGDRRAEIVSLETLGPDGRPTAVLRSHDPVTVRVVVKFMEPVSNPVIGIMIRTRVGLEVFGTNTELEAIDLGLCNPGDEVKVDFQFACELCPGEYTLTAASHDPDGTPHDWLDDAIAFSVADERYTAGVANLRATVRAVKTPAGTR